MLVIEHDNTQIVIEWMEKFLKDHAHSVRMSGTEEIFDEFTHKLDCHLNDMADSDEYYQEKEA